MPFTAAVDMGPNPRARDTTGTLREQRVRSARPARRGVRMPDEAGRDGDTEAPRDPSARTSIDRRTLVKLVAAGGALVGVPALLGRVNAANARSPLAGLLAG